MYRKLHIGGTIAASGWEVFNIKPDSWVDHVGTADDLSRFDDSTFAEIYASHILEHLDYRGSLPRALAEWHRVLVPNGLLMVSVPDLDVLCALFCQQSELGPQDRFHIMRMIFGGHTDSHDYHLTGLNGEILSCFLRDAGFIDLKRVERFGLFDDTSDLSFGGQAISLNMIACKSGAGGGGSLAGSSKILGYSGEAIENGFDKALQHYRQGASPLSLTRHLVGASTGWGRGYFTGISYDAYSFRELAPNWIDFGLLSQRQRPPRACDGSEFAYLELGSGMGLGLCLLAASYPEGRFVGIDFHPDHVAHSQWLRRELQLDNITFYEADFLELAAHPDRLPLGGSMDFDYVVAHGILSWVSMEVRHALLALGSSLLRSGGAFYCSYNTFPGWLEHTAFKALVDLERQRQGPEGFITALNRASHTILRLLANPVTNSSPLAQAFPRLEDTLQAIHNMRSPSYLCGEYGAENWQPFYVGEVHRMAASHKLSYVASASLPENHVSLLPDHLAAVVEAEADPTVQQALLDLAINQSFRRDLFVKGALPLSRAAQEQQLALQRLRWTASPTAASLPDDGERIQTSLGRVTVAADRCRAVQAALADQPATLGDIYQASGLAPSELVILTSLLLHAGNLGLDRAEAGEAAAARCRTVNQRLMDLMQGGHNLAFLAAPFTGHGAQSFSVLDSFVLQGLQQGLEGEVLSSCVWMGIEASGVELRGPDGALLSDPQDCLSHIDTYITSFRSSTWPRLVQLGIVDPPA